MKTDTQFVWAPVNNSLQVSAKRTKPPTVDTAHEIGETVSLCHQSMPWTDGNAEVMNEFHRRPSYAHRILGSLGGKHCKSLQRIVRGKSVF